MLSPTAERVCDQCGVTFVGERSPRRVHLFCGQPCWAAWRRALPRRVTPLQARRLRENEPIPDLEPRRFLTRDGYVLLRWRVGVNAYVEALEHRVVTGRCSEHVHHINGITTDNRRENLQPITASEHARLRASVDYDEAGRLYAEGLSLPDLSKRYGIHAVSIMRALKSRGVKMRTGREAWQLRKAAKAK